MPSLYRAEIAIGRIPPTRLEFVAEDSSDAFRRVAEHLGGIRAAAVAVQVREVYAVQEVAKCCA